MILRVFCLFLLLLTGCAKPTTVSPAPLDDLKQKWQEPKLSTWYYAGSKDGFHYFYHEDLPEGKMYRVSETELSWPDSFSYTGDRGNWRLLRWGIHAEKVQGEK